MAQYKYTAQRGKNNMADVAITAGAPEAQSDTISINMDITNMTRGEALQLIDVIEMKILNAPFPPL
jgi:hypothetical protein